ncbi:MAG: PEP-utilizing enzyme [Anaerolineae bacterium]|nr:PEP-utilizing enzyme [Anaerolineae bacterium]
MNPSPTPFTHSVVCVTLTAALKQLGVETTPIDDAFADHVAAAWGQSPGRIRHLLGRPATADEHNGPRAKTPKALADLTTAGPAQQERLRQWAQRIYGLPWTQAQILQVMEEIEPYMTAAWLEERRWAAAAVGSYAALLDRLPPSTDPGLALDLVAGLRTPDAELVADLAAGAPDEAWRARWGHRGAAEAELATPRLREVALPAVDGAVMGGWQPAAAEQRRREAEATVLGRAGLLQRSGLRKAIETAQRTLVAHNEARDTLAHVLAAARTWALAAAAEGLRDGRLDHADDIFWLELEEIKQMMTGEWHSRGHVQPLIVERRAAHRRPEEVVTAATAPLGVAGSALTAAAAAVACRESLGHLPAGHIAIVPQTGPDWAPLFLRAGGIVCRSGDYLCFTAAVARYGGLPTLVAAADPTMPRTTARLRLDPPRHALEWVP